MTLKEYIEGRGATNVAKLLDINESTVSHWYRLRTCPRPEQMKRIIKDSSGFVTYESIIEPFLKNKKKTK